MKIYLSGGMERKRNLGAGWRDLATEKLAKYGIKTLDPVVLEKDDPEALNYNWVEGKLAKDLTSYRQMIRDKMFRKDVQAIQKCDAILLYYDESVRLGAGTLAEAWEGFREGRPIYVVTHYPRKEIPGWLIGESTQIFKEFSECFEYISDKKQVERDKDYCEKLREECLSGIYKV